MSVHRSWVVQGLLVAAVGLALVAAGSRLWWAHAARRPPAVARAAERTSGATEVTFWVEEGRGRGDATFAPAADAGLAGLTRAEVERRYPAWRVTAFSPRRVVLERSVRGPADITLGLRAGQVAIFFGPPQAPLTPVEFTGIPVRDLLAADRARLAAGLRVPSLASAWQILDGLGAP